MRQAYQVEGTNILDLLNEHSVAIHSCQHVPFFLSKKVIGRDTPVVSLSTQSTHFIIYEDDSAVSWILEAVPRAMPSECPAIPTLLHPQLLDTQHPHLPQVQRGSSSHANKKSSGSMATTLMLQTGCIMCRPVWEMTMLGPWFSISKNLESAAAEHHTHPPREPSESQALGDHTGLRPRKPACCYFSLLLGDTQRGGDSATVPERTQMGDCQQRTLTQAKRLIPGELPVPPRRAIQIPTPSCCGGKSSNRSWPVRRRWMPLNS